MDSVIQKKICMLGDFAVGKTSLVHRFVEGRFDDRYLSTIGVKVSRRIVTLAERTTVHLLVWDLAGSEEFTGVQASYLQGAAGALLVCDLTRSTTLDSLSRYAQRLREVRPQANLILVGNKNDLTAERAIEDDDLAALASELRATWFTTSAKSGENVEAAFTSLAKCTLAG
ncbi:MAG: Rab family GTPase [Anaerolineales bacterium]